MARDPEVPSDQTIFVDTITRRRGTLEQWVARFAELWAGGARFRDDFITLLSPNVRLVAPGLAPTQGREAGRQAFNRTFDALPDLTAEVISWAARGEVLFLELRFSATIGGRLVVWPAVDRFRFEGGEAVERVIHFDRTPLRRAYFGSLRGLAQLWHMRRIRGR